MKEAVGRIAWVDEAQSRQLLQRRESGLC